MPPILRNFLSSLSPYDATVVFEWIDNTRFPEIEMMAVIEGSGKLPEGYPAPRAFGVWQKENGPVGDSPSIGRGRKKRIQS